MKKFIFLVFLMINVAIAKPDSLCDKNRANFDYELAQPFHSMKRIVPGWGPTRAILHLSPDLSSCMNTADLSWQQQRILAAADYWVNQKLNYCHHYLPNFATPQAIRMKTKGGGYCSAALDIMPGTPYYQKAVRWNYSGQGRETRAQWLNKNMWYGMDCSNYTTFLYDFAFGLVFSSKITAQAGQGDGSAQANLSPNQQTDSLVLANTQAAGRLVCRDNTLEVNHSCKKHGGYLSVIDSQGIKHKGSITSADLAALPLHPGDLLFIAATGPNSLTPSKVTHVVMWTGKQVGYGENTISPSQIAPNGLCSKKTWIPNIGDWVITDSHYQGADYRVLTPCFYLNNLWGVRRVIY